MNSIWSEIKSGWKDSWWIGYFCGYLILLVSLSVLINRGVKGKLETAASVLQISLAVLCGVISYLLAQHHTRKAKYKNVGSSPGGNLLVLAAFLFSQTKMELTFEPLVADWRHEYFEALTQDRKWKARWISLSYSYAFIKVICQSPISLLWRQLRSVSRKG